MAGFPTTRWAQILALRGQPGRHSELMGQLVRWYWRPLYLYVRYKGLSPNAAEDAVQGLFTRLIERDAASALDPDKGRLRSYLRTAMNRYLADLHVRASAHKRGGKFVFQPLEIDGAERQLADARDLGPDRAYERAWAKTVLERAFARLREEYESGRRSGPFALVERYFDPGDDAGLQELGEAFSMSPAQVKAFLHRARTRFRQLVREQVAETVADVDDVAAEVAELEQILRG